MRQLGIGTDAHMIDSNNIGQRTNVFRVVQRRVGEMRPDTDRPTCVGDDFGLLPTDKPGAHHVGHARVAAQLRIEAGMGDDDGPGRDVECSLRSLHIRVSKVHQDAQPVAFFDDGRTECGQPAEARRIRVDIAQRNGGVAVMQ